MLIFGFVSWDRLASAFGIGMGVSVALVLALMAVYVAWMESSRRSYLGRLPLSDEEFSALCPSPGGLDPQIVNHVRMLAARRFGSIGGNRFHPDDRLEEDLHLPDAAPWALEDFWIDLAELLGVDEDQAIEQAFEVVTFGDIVRLADRSWKAKKSKSS